MFYPRTHYHSKQSTCMQHYMQQCDKVYIGRTSQPLEERIRQNVLKLIRDRVKPQKDLPENVCTT